MSGEGGGAPLLSVRGLTVEVLGEAGSRPVVEGLSFDLRPGETLAIAGESGSGKSMTALALMGLLPRPGARIAGGRAVFDGADLLAMPESRLRRIRGGEIAMIFQEPMTSLNPVMTVGAQIVEAIQAHEPIGRSEARARALELLRTVRLTEPERRLDQHPHELSGGMRQRVMIAIALACRPKLLIADEPTTALDVTVQAQILRLMKALQREIGAAVILITHDMGVVAETADRVLVMKDGRAVETAAVGDLFARPAEPYTRDLLAAAPRLGEAGPEPAPALEARVAEVTELSVRFDVRGGLLRRPVARLHAVEGVSFDIRAGETLSLVGESGCGKSTTGKAMLGLIPFAGSVRIAGRSIGGLSRAAMKPVLRDVQMVFQDPYAALDPRMPVGDLVGEPLEIHDIAHGSDKRDRVAELFRRVGLSPDWMRRHPHEFSGGQRQRLCIARALALRPKLIVADESVSALDVSVQARVLELLAELQAEMGLSYLFISHDLAVVERISHRVAVMQAGRIVEIGRRAAVFSDPRHPYTLRLLEAAPIPDPTRRRDRPALEGEPESPLRPLDWTPTPHRLAPIGADHFVAA
jgi:peptide/nickel transport system ATP-binding protein